MAYAEDVLVAQRLDVWPRRYRFVFDDAVAEILAPSVAWRSGAGFALFDSRYFVDDGGTRLELKSWDKEELQHAEWSPQSVEPALLAEAERTGRARWAITGGGQAYELRRSGLRPVRRLYAGAERVGSIRRQGKDATADLPGLAPAFQAFVLIVALKGWDPFVTKAVGLTPERQAGGARLAASRIATARQQHRRTNRRPARNAARVRLRWSELPGHVPDEGSRFSRTTVSLSYGSS